jgi:uncharacterized membrane protein HdeD (DUF308 family)
VGRTRGANLAASVSEEGVRGMLETIGIVLIVQGVGGFINRLADSESKGWWLQLHVLPDGLHLPVSVAMGS